MAAAAPAYFICMANGWRARTRSPARLLFGVERDRHSAVQLRHFGTERSGVAAPKVLEGQRRTKFPRHSRVTGRTLGRSHGPTAWTDGRRDRRERKEGGTERSEEEDCRAERAHTHTHTHTHTRNHSYRRIIFICSAWSKAGNNRHKASFKMGC